MARRDRVSCTAAAMMLFSVAAQCPGAAAERLILDRAAIVIDSDQPTYMQHAVEDLRGYLKELTGNDVRIGVSADYSASATIVVGPRAAERVLGRSPAAEKLGKLGEEGFVLKSCVKEGKPLVVAAGAAAMGTKHAVARLMQLLGGDGKSAWIDGPVDLVTRPAFAKRGMHLNGWAFHAPYSFRAWREEDWRRYLDLLSYEGVNLFFLWPFMEIIPVPLSGEDRSYLEECRRVVEYAQKKHGMEVWLMQCTNRVARDRCGVADPRRRPYWRPSQEDLNPGDPRHFQAIMASREALYRAVDNVDGVCNIDSDPGYYRGSPLGDYFKVLRGCRELLDRCTRRGKETKLVNWMWCGWGLPPERFFDRGHQALTIRGLRSELPEPWWLVNGQFEYLPLCREAGVLAKTVLLPYGVIEAEPSYPTTNVHIDALRDAFDRHMARCPGLAGAMGNVQTPLLQLPHVHFYTSTLWDLGYRKRSEKEALLDLAARLHPEHGQLIADCYLALKATEPARIEALADQLAALVAHDKLGRSGVFARKLFPDRRIVANSLVLQLRLVAARERLLSVAPGTEKAECAKRIRDFFDAYLAWDTAHGWHALWGWKQWPLGTFTAAPRFAACAGRLNRALGSKAEVDRCFEQIAAGLIAKYGQTPVREGCIAPLAAAILSAAGIDSLAQKAKATASVVPDPVRYPPSAANDGLLSTLYWPGALVQNNREWLQLTWDAPQTFDKVVVRFLQHPSMRGRTIHLQTEIAPQRWEDFATSVVPDDPATPHAVATFRLPSPVTMRKLRVVNLLDLFEIEVR